jgi:hypothetical protein
MGPPICRPYLGAYLVTFQGSLYRVERNLGWNQGCRLTGRLLERTTGFEKTDSPWQIKKTNLTRALFAHL